MLIKSSTLSRKFVKNWFPSYIYLSPCATNICEIMRFCNAKLNTTNSRFFIVYRYAYAWKPYTQCVRREKKEKESQNPSDAHWKLDSSHYIGNLHLKLVKRINSIHLVEWAKIDTFFPSQFLQCWICITEFGILYNVCVLVNESKVSQNFFFPMLLFNVVFLHCRLY